MLRINRMKSTIELEERVTVAYKKEGEYFQARALEFDIVGTGKTRAKAFQDLKGLFSEYVLELLDSTGDIDFYFPADKEEWNTHEKEVYVVTFEIGKIKGISPPPRIMTLAQMRPYPVASIKNIDLRAPVYGCT